MEGEISDRLLMSDRIWDPGYLYEICQQDFYQFEELWGMNPNDMELVKEVEKVESYCPIVEDISLDDEVLCSAVTDIEEK